jgi:hypothetical protein
MRTLSSSRTQGQVSTLLALIRIGIFLLPGALLLLGALRTEGPARTLFSLGSSFEALLCWLIVGRRRAWRQPVGPFVITLYLLALGWLCLVPPPPSEDWYPHFARSLFVSLPLAVFAVQMLTNSGAASLRAARVLAQRLAARKDWPVDLAACRELPEVKAFREALHLDATPALNLLHHRSVPVRIAALAALEFRANWRPGQAELVLQVACSAQEPAIRAAAINALANVDNRLLVDELANFLHDPSWEVRRATTEALLWNSERRWPWVRNAVRQSLADPAYLEDGPLRPAGQLLTAEAVADLNAWASEKGILATRAAQSLGVHYLTALGEQTDGNLLRELQYKVADPHTPPVLRLELAGILKSIGTWDKALLEKLLDPSNPAPLRLLAAETLLNEENDAHAVAALHDIARLPNREIALATAEVVQRQLGVDLGLPLGQPLPPVHSRQAAEVTRRVMLWATQPEGSLVTTAENSSPEW